MESLDAKATKLATLMYTAISLIITIAFLTATFLTGKTYTPVARIGGMIWVFILSMIVTMPIVIPVVKKKVIG